MTQQLTKAEWIELVKPEAQKRKRDWGIRDRDINLRLADLKPYAGSPVPLDKQAKIVSTLRDHIDEGWAFFGTPGVGKSTWATGLFHQAVMNRLLDENNHHGEVLPASLWRITARALCQQAQDRATRSGESSDDFCGDPGELFRASQRVVSRERIERAHKRGLKPHLFIEEWDKVGLTDFRRETLFDVLDCMYNVDGQLVITSNLTWPDFCATFGETNWRLGKICNICRIEDVDKPEIIAKES